VRKSTPEAGGGEGARELAAREHLRGKGDQERNFGGVVFERTCGKATKEDQPRSRRGEAGLHSSGLTKKKKSPYHSSSNHHKSGKKGPRAKGEARKKGSDDKGRFPIRLLCGSRRADGAQSTL